MMEPTFLLAFTTGLFGGFGHCIGMCGPIVVAYSTCWNQASGLGTSITNHLTYNFGRILTYTFIGSLIGLSGQLVSFRGQYEIGLAVMPIAAGIIMGIMGLQVSGLFRISAKSLVGTDWILKLAKSLIESESKMRFFPLGLLLGFMPCGLSYTIFVGALGTGSLFSGFFYTLCFGLGTIPGQLLLGLLTKYLTAALRYRLYQVSGLLIVVMGVIFIYRGWGQLANL